MSNRIINDKEKRNKQSPIIYAYNDTSTLNLKIKQQALGYLQICTLKLFVLLHLTDISYVKLEDIIAKLFFTITF
jgi:hypothetical protein